MKAILILWLDYFVILDYFSKTIYCCMLCKCDNLSLWIIYQVWALGSITFAVFDLLHLHSICTPWFVKEQYSVIFMPVFLSNIYIVFLWIIFTWSHYFHFSEDIEQQLFKSGYERSDSFEWRKLSLCEFSAEMIYGQLYILGCVSCCCL